MTAKFGQCWSSSIHNVLLVAESWQATWSQKQQDKVSWKQSLQLLTFFNSQHNWIWWCTLGINKEEMKEATKGPTVDSDGNMASVRVWRTLCASRLEQAVIYITDAKGKINHSPSQALFTSNQGRKGTTQVLAAHTSRRKPWWVQILLSTFVLPPGVRCCNQSETKVGGLYHKFLSLLIHHMKIIQNRF